MIPNFPSPLRQLAEESLTSKEALEASTTRSQAWRDARLCKHADYQRAYRASRKQFSASMSWFLALRQEPVETKQKYSAKFRSGSGIGPRVGLTVGKVLGKAHERNRIKRRLREVVRRHLGQLPNGIDLILHPKRSSMTMDFVKLDAEVLRIFRQAAAQSKIEVQRNAPGAAASPPSPAAS